MERSNHFRGYARSCILFAASLMQNCIVLSYVKSSSIFDSVLGERHKCFSRQQQLHEPSSNVYFTFTDWNGVAISASKNIEKKPWPCSACTESASGKGLPNGSEIDFFSLFITKSNTKCIYAICTCPQHEICSTYGHSVKATGMNVYVCVWLCVFVCLSNKHCSKLRRCWCVSLVLNI